ncbi:MAG: Lrp/AsnC ligand binding domain-containing protein [Nitrososphaerales archaeon]|nr:Lrp/AsnC ligand binding domain-containing protein [Nitrososphaerales archaeon]
MSRFQKAFVLLKVRPGHEKRVMDDLLKLPEVREVHIVPGQWDLIAIVEIEKEAVVPSDRKVYSVVMDRIGKIKHVQDTDTMVSQFSRSK